MSKMDTDMITISRFITEKQRESGGSGEFTQLTNGLVSAVKEKGQHFLFDFSYIQLKWVIR